MTVEASGPRSSILPAFAAHESIREIDMNTCEKCGNQVPEEKAFCPNCGAAMMPERERKTSVAEGMGETMYEPIPPLKKPLTSKPLPPLAKATVEPAPSAPDKSRRQPSVVAHGLSKAALKSTPERKPKRTPAVNTNRTLSLILSVAAGLFALSILVVAILYFMGKI